MKLTTLFPRKYATGADLKGEVVTLSIARVTLESMHPAQGRPAEEKPVIYFERCQKGIILTRPLAHQIADIVGSEETDEWKGCRVTLYPQKMQVAGQDRIAVRAKAPSSITTPPPEGLQDEEE